MSDVHILADPNIEGVTRISGHPSFPAPHVVVVGAIHGNEPCGLHALRQIQHDAETGRLPMGEGTIVLVHGNPYATREDKRHTGSGYDLNRLFDFAFETRLRPDKWGPEHHRAVALRPVFEAAEAAIDLHSATSPTPPFAIVTSAPGSESLARTLGLNFITRGWEDLNIMSGRIMLSVLTRQGKPAIAVECGQHWDESAPGVAYRSATRFLAGLGVLDDERTIAKEPLIIDVVRALRRPSDQFSFAERWHGMHILRRNEVLGSDADVSVSMSNDRYLLLPNDAVDLGGDMVFLGRVMPQ